MSEGFEVFRLLTQEWTALADGRPARAALVRWSAQEPALGDVGSMADLVGECHRRGDPARSAALRGALVRLADDPLAARALLQALTPGLVKMVNRVQRQTPWVGPAGVWPTLGDVSAELVAFAVEVIRGAAGRDVRWPQTVLLDGVWHRVWAAGRRWQRWGAGQQVLSLGYEATHPAAEVVALLAEAVARGRVSVSDAELIRRYRVDDEPATVIALERGCSAVALRARRERAEKVLAGLGRAG